MIDQTRIAVITGAAQGLGLETARQLDRLGHTVILTGRDEAAMAGAAEKIGTGADFHRLDVADDASVATFFDWLDVSHGLLDIFVKNAGRIYGAHGATIANAPGAVDDGRAGLRAHRQRLLRHGRAFGNGPGRGPLSGLEGDAQCADDPRRARGAPGVKVDAVCPGWVRTVMGGPSATRNIEEGARGIVWAATLPDDGPSGGFLRDGQPIDW